jgi:hypothetical protein
MNQIEQRTMKKVFRHLVPFLMFCYFFNFLDRVNVSFAALDMNRDLGFSVSVFGFGSGILFLSYMLLCCAKRHPTLCWPGLERENGSRGSWSVGHHRLVHDVHHRRV